MKINTKYLLIGVAAIALICFVYLWNSPGKYDNFAKCLTENGAVMYGTDWCHFCQNQKALFGKSFNHIDYRDCDLKKQECNDAGVEGYPTWRINDVNYAGVQSLERLSILTGCTL